MYTRWFLLIFSLGILILILWNTYLLFQTFKHEERVKMEIWAESYKSINNADKNTNVDLPLAVLSKNTTIPIILTFDTDSISEASNLSEEATKVLKEKNYAGKSVTFGIRPENLDDDAELVQEHPDELVDVTVEVIELMGSESYIYTKEAGHTMTVRVSGTTPLKVGEILS